MSCLPLPLNSCSITWRSPDDTIPTGRLQGDVRLFEFGGLAEFCSTEECGDGRRGLGLCLLGVDQTTPEDPATCESSTTFDNPLRISSDNKLWAKLPPQPMKKTATTASQDSYVQGGNADSVTALGAPTTVEVEHKKGCDVARLKRTITVIGASIEDPPGTATGGTVPVNVTVATTPITPAGTVETGQFVTGIQTGADANGHTTINPQNGEAVTGIGAGQPVEVVTGITEAKFNCSELDDCEGNPANVCYQIDVDGIKVPIVGACTGGCPTNSTTVCLPDIDISPGDTVTVTAQPELFVKTPAGDRFPITHGQIILCAEIEYAPPGGFEEDC